MQALALADRLATVEDIASPWPHAILDEFLPEDVFADLAAGLSARPSLSKSYALPAAVLDLLLHPAVEAAIQQRWGFDAGRTDISLTFRTTPLAPHKDRRDKLWSGILYLAGDGTGTHLFDGAGLAKAVEFTPNRLLCWGKSGAKHAVPRSQGRYAIQWWFLE